MRVTPSTAYPAPLPNGGAVAGPLGSGAYAADADRRPGRPPLGRGGVAQGVQRAIDIVDIDDETGVIGSA